MTRVRLSLVSGLILAAVAGCGPTIWYQQNTISVLTGGGDTAFQYQGDPTPIQIGVVEACLADPGVKAIWQYYDTVLYCRRNGCEMGFLAKAAYGGVLSNVDYMIRVLAAAGIEESAVDGKTLQRLFARMVSKGVAKAILNEGYARFSLGGLTPDEDGKSLGVGPGGGGYITPRPAEQELRIHIAVEISTNAVRHYTFDLSEVDVAWSKPVDQVPRKVAAGLITFQDVDDIESDADEVGEDFE